MPVRDSRALWYTPRRAIYKEGSQNEIEMYLAGSKDGRTETFTPLYTGNGAIVLLDFFLSFNLILVQYFFTMLQFLIFGMVIQISVLIC